MTTPTRLTPIAVAGPSGVGKGTLVKMLMARNEECFGLSVSSTTRAPRQGETNGVEYHFTNRDDILQDSLYEIDVQGCESVKKSALPCKYIFITPPSEDELRRRLVIRNTETPEQIERRMATAKRELEYVNKPGFFDHVIVNNDLEAAYKELLAIVQHDVATRQAYLQSIGK